MEKSNSIKRAQRKARQKALEDQEKARRVAKKEEKLRKEAAFKQTIVGDQIVDGEGNPIRRYSLAERFFDNKLLSYGTAVGIILLSLLALLAIHGF